MAGERKGITYEAIVKIALETLIRKGTLTGAVFWNEKPASATIEPDFTVGADKDHPTHVFLITHSGAAGNSHMKFWRNIGELAEAKVRLPTPPRVYSVVFDSAIKEDLKVLQDIAFDGQLLVGNSQYGSDLLRWVDSNAGSLPKDRDDKVDSIREDIKNNPAPTGPKHLVGALGRDLGTLVQTTHPELDSLWLMERTRPARPAPAARDTFLRRGVAKLLLLDRSDDVEPSGRLKNTVSQDVVEALKTMGLAVDSIGGTRVTDPQMLWAVRSLPSALLFELHKVRTVDRMAEYIESLRSLAGVHDQLAYLAKHWRVLTTGAGLYTHLKLCHHNPHKLCPSAVAPHSRRVWLFHVLIEWIKFSRGTRTAYGLAQLVEDVDHLASDPRHRSSVKAIIGHDLQWQAKRSVELGLTDWHSSPSKQHFAFSNDDLARVADALARQLSQLHKPSPTDNPAIVEAVVQTVLEAKLITYRHFNPFEVLIYTELSKIGYQGTLEVAVRACFAEAASAAGADLDPRSSGTKVMRVKNTLIKWQSAHDSHTNDKRKELCGRAPALRYSWGSSTKAFVRRPDTDKLILVVDGTWRQEDLNALTRAGWDNIFYPDEMDRLVKAIV